MFKFTPLSEEQINASNLMEAGTYYFTVLNCTRTVSEKKGNPMAKLHLNIWDKEGKSHTIFDYLVFSGHPFNLRKIRRFCYAVGLQAEYEKGEIPEDLTNFSGKAVIDIEQKQPNPNGGFYDAKNIISDYIAEDSIKPDQTNNPPETKSDFVNDDIHF